MCDVEAAGSEIDGVAAGGRRGIIYRLRHRFYTLLGEAVEAGFEAVEAAGGCGAL